MFWLHLGLSAISWKLISMEKEASVFYFKTVSFSVICDWSWSRSTHTHLKTLLLTCIIVGHKPLSKATDLFLFPLDYWIGFIGNKHVEGHIPQLNMQDFPDDLACYVPRGLDIDVPSTFRFARATILLIFLEDWSNLTPKCQSQCCFIPAVVWHHHDEGNFNITNIFLCYFRLSDSNIKSISGQMEELYMKYSRNGELERGRVYFLEVGYGCTDCY